MNRRPGKGAILVGLLASVVLHVAIAWLLGVRRIGFPEPPAPTGPPELVVFRDPLLDPPPAVRIPEPAIPVPRPLPPTSEAEEELPPLETTALVPPEVIPHDIPPRLVNGPEVLAALESGYPDDMPEEASESQVLLWLFVDTGGRVTKLRLQESSGFAALDDLATGLAPRMAYSPALHRGQRVAVWVAQRIRFVPPDGALGR